MESVESTGGARRGSPLRRRHQFRNRRNSDWSVPSADRKDAMEASSSGVSLSYTVSAQTLGSMWSSGSEVMRCSPRYYVWRNCTTSSIRWTYGPCRPIDYLRFLVGVCHPARPYSTSMWHGWHRTRVLRRRAAISLTQSGFGERPGLSRSRSPRT